MRLGLLLVAAVLAAASMAEVGSALVLEGGGTAPGYEPRFESAPCPNQIPQPALEDARCGFLVVPEDRSKPAGRSIRLAVAIIPSISPNPAPDPIVHLTGGPGGVAILQSQRIVGAGFNQNRDLIVMDQRGTLYSEPLLTCPSIDEFNLRLLSLRLDAESTRRAHVAATRACREHLVAQGVDLSAYNSTENAADFADLRRVLGYEKWNVFGVSYGTDLALNYLRTDPDGIRSVILDSPAPPWVVTLPGFWPNARDGFDDLFRACAAQTSCRRAHPRLRRTFTNLVRRLERRPVQATLPDPLGDGNVRVVLDGGAFVNWLVATSLYTPNFKNVPAWIGRLARGKPKRIAASRASQVTPPGFLGVGLTLGVICREWFPFATDTQILTAGRHAFPRYPDSVLGQVPQFTYMNDDCRVWGVPAAPASFREPVRSDTPTLVISGTFDAITSATWSREVAERLANSTVVEIPGVGHFVVPESACAQAVMASFLADPNSPDTTCVAALKPPAFVTR